jgi:CRISPR-associated protein Csh2
LFDKDFKDTLDLKEAFEAVTKTDDLKDLKKKDILPKLLECIDVRLFGAVFSPEGAKKDNKDENKNISIHGCVQINHATDLYKEGRVYTDEILAPFTAIGSMSKATEAHYIHNFSVNPKNLSSWEKTVSGIKTLSTNDIVILKNAFNNSATFYDSHSKAGVENELSIYVTLSEDSILTLPNFSQFITFEKDKEGNNSFDITKLIDYLGKYKSEIEKIELYYIEELLEVKNSSKMLQEKIKKHDLLEILPEEENKEEEDETAS